MFVGWIVQIHSAASNYSSLAEKFAPVWVFSKSTKYFHTSPEIIYQAHNDLQICNQHHNDKNKNLLCYNNTQLEFSDKKVIYEVLTYKECPNQLSEIVINYWRYHLNQQNCLLAWGGHWHDWERISLLIRNGKVAAVTFHQHSGSYTKTIENVQLYQERPVVYVSDTAAGSYHLPYGTDQLNRRIGRSIACTYYSGDYGKLWNPDDKADDLFNTKSRTALASSNLEDINNPTLINLGKWVISKGYDVGNSIWQRGEHCINTYCKGEKSGVSCMFGFKTCGCVESI